MSTTDMMILQPFQLAASEDTPEVSLNSAEGVIRLSGRSLPENAWKFYKPLIEWTRAYCASRAGTTTVELQLDYFNSSSGRYLYELLTILEQESKDREGVRIVWKTEKDDELMIEKGEELKSLLDLEFEIHLI